MRGFLIFGVGDDLHTANETGVFQNQLFLLFFWSEIRKSIDNDTKNQVENYDYHYEEEQQIVNDSGDEQWFLKRK